MSGINTVDEQGTDSTSQLKSSQISIRGFKGEKLTLGGKEVVDTILQTEAIVQKVIGMNGEQIVDGNITLQNKLH